ncbi:MAG: MFS transporter [Deltaproteobacteria bacterium]|nr:MFS transporter [Deltaproteobacteria bacterium]MBW2283446.1 MFS transporter [Deltaproteobacteria bacterium]
MNHNEKNILIVSCFGHFMSHFNMLMFPALVMPLTAKFGMDLTAVLALSFWMYLLFGLSALPWGLLTDAVGAKPMMLGFFIGAGLCGLAAAFYMDDPTLFAVSLAGVGVFSGIYHPAGLGLISRGVSRMSMGMGYNGMAGNAGLAAAPVLTGVANYLFGAKAAYVCLGGLNFAGAALILFLRWDEPPPGAVRTESHGRRSLISGFVVLLVCMMLGGVAYRGASVILPSYFELRNQTLFDFFSRVDWLPASRNVAATMLASLVFLVGIFGQYLGGRAAERYEPRKMYFLFHALALPMALAVAFTTDIPLFFFAMAYMFFMLGMQPIENTLVAYLTPDKLRHSGFGLKFIVTFGVGSLSVHLVGWIKEAWSLPAVFVALSVVSVGILLSILLLMAVTRKMQLRN